MHHKYTIVGNNPVAMSIPVEPICHYIIAR